MTDRTESDHTPAALPQAEAQGDTNLTQPSAGEQPTSAEPILEQKGREVT